MERCDMSKILLVDGSNYLFRAFHGLPDLRTSAGEPTGAMRGFFSMLGKVWSLVKPSHAVIVFDAPGKNFRHDMYPDYKANRPPMPEDLREQIEPLMAAIQDFGWPLLQVGGVEADDVIATLAAASRAKGLEVVIATGDKDMAQLVGDGVVLINTMNTQFYDREGVREKYGVYPERIIDYLALMGDKVDNVPGIEKCGPKTAAKWIDQYGDLEGIKAHAAEVKGKAGEYLRAGLEFLDQARELVTIKRDCVLPQTYADPLSLCVRAADEEAVAQFCRRWEMSPSTVLRAAPAGTKKREGVSTEETQASGADAQGELGGLFAQGATPAQAQSQPLVNVEQAQIPLDENEELLAPDAVPFTVVDTEFSLAQLLTGLDAPRSQPVAITVLSSGTVLQAEIAGVGIALSAKEVYVWHIGNGYAREALLTALKPWLESEAPKVAHDAKALRHALRAQGIEPQGTWDDTMLMSYVLEAHLKHELEAIARRSLKRGITPIEQILGKGAKAIAPDAAAPEMVQAWLAEQAAVIRAAYAALTARLEEDKRLEGIYERIERPLLVVLDRMEERGVAIDTFCLAQEADALNVRLNELEKKAYELATHPFKLSSPKQLGEVLFTEMKLPVIKKTASGAPSTDEDVLNELALDYPLPKVILEYRMLAKLLSTYLEKLPRMVDARDGRVHTTFGQATAVTGRLASSEPNLQNIPVRTPEGRRIREGFVAEKGFQILSADYSQIELRIMAHLSADDGLLKAFSQGRDVHRATAAEVFKKAPEAVSADERRMAKVINFGLIYGMSAFGLAQNLGIDRKIAQHYVEEYFDRYPGVKRYMEQTRADARDNGYVETFFGRRLWIPDIHSTRKPVQAAAERAAINAPMQGTAADLIKLAMIAVEDFLRQGGYRSRLVLQVHDELIVEVADAEIELMREAIPRLMAEVASLSVPLIAEVGVGENWEVAH